MVLKKDVIVLSLGGSVVLSDDVDNTFFDEFKTFIQHLLNDFKVYLIIGGGKTARTYINLGRMQGFQESDLDQLGIQSTRLNAFYLSLLLNSGNKKIPETVEEALTIDEDLVVMGGTSPGHSTDYVGAELACKTHAKMYIIATNVDGVYDKDPNLDPQAKHLSEVSIETLLNQYGAHWDKAGKNMVIDGPAMQKIKDCNIQTYVINGKNIHEIDHILRNKPFVGTKISPEFKQ
jgi:uridylate kinase